MEKVTTKNPEIKPRQEQEGPKIVKGYEEGVITKDPFIDEDAHNLAQEAILREQEIAKYQREILKSKQQEIVSNDEKDLDLPLNETEERLFNNLGYDRSFIKEKRRELEAVSPGRLYNEIQEISLQGMINFIKTREEAGAGTLLNKLIKMKEEISRIKNNGDTIKPFKELMTNANEASSSLLMEDLNKVLKNSGYKGKTLGIFGKKESIDSFQDDITNTLLQEEQKIIFDKVKKEIEKNATKYEKNTRTRTVISQGATQIQREYGKNGITAKIEDIIKEIK